MKLYRNTKQKQLILSVVQTHHDHPRADDIYLEVHARDGRISRGTVYRVLKQLAEAGEITHVKVPSADRFDERLDRHYHLICTECGAVFDAPLSYCDAIDQTVAEQTGFRIDRHRMIWEGVCPLCQSGVQE